MYTEASNSTSLSQRTFNLGKKICIDLELAPHFLENVFIIVYNLYSKFIYKFSIAQSGLIVFSHIFKYIKNINILLENIKHIPILMQH